LDVVLGGDILKSDTFNIGKESSRKKFIAELKKIKPDEVPDTVEEEIADGLMSIMVESRARKEAPPSGDKPAESRDDFLLAKLPKEVVEAAWNMLESDDLFEQIAADIEGIGIIGEVTESKAIYIVMTSRLLSEPLSAVVLGASASGKSYKIEVIALLIPPQGKVMAHDFSPKVMSHMPEGSLKHRVVISGERVHNKYGKEGQTEDHGKPFREMTASKFYRVAFVDRDDKGHFIVRHIEQEGPIAYIESTTATYIPDEDSTRLIKLATDESEEQTGRIQELQKRKAKGETADDARRTAIINKHHALQLLLNPLQKSPPQVIIPYIDCITLPNNVVATRRNFPYVVSMIEAVALLRQYHPSKTGGGKPDWEQRAKAEKIVIVADKMDYRITYDMLLPILEKMYGSLPSPAKELLNIIIGKTRRVPQSITLIDGRKTMVDKNKPSYDKFTATDCVGWAGVSKAQIWRRLKSLTIAGILNEDTNSKPYRYQVVNSDLAETANILDGGLPTPDEMDKLIEDTGRKEVTPNG
jgi:hypothetical protein